MILYSTLQNKHTLLYSTVQNETNSEETIILIIIYRCPLYILIPQNKRDSTSTVHHKYILFYFTKQTHSTLQNKLKRTQNITHRIHSTLQNELKQAQDTLLLEFKGL